MLSAPMIARSMPAAKPVPLPPDAPSPPRDFPAFRAARRPLAHISCAFHRDSRRFPPCASAENERKIAHASTKPVTPRASDHTA